STVWTDPSTSTVGSVTGSLVDGTSVVPVSPVEGEPPSGSGAGPSPEGPVQANRKTSIGGLGNRGFGGSQGAEPSLDRIRPQRARSFCPELPGARQRRLVVDGAGADRRAGPPPRPARAPGASERVPYPSFATARMSFSRMRRWSTPSIFTSSPA